MLAASRAIRKGTDATSGGPDEPTEPEPDSTSRDREASAVSPAGSVALTRMMCGPGDKLSVTLAAVLRGVNWPWSTSPTMTEAAVDGGVVATEALADRTVPCGPARSVAKNSRECRPSPSPNGPAYVCHEPLSTRYVTRATPLVAS